MTNDVLDETSQPQPTSPQPPSAYEQMRATAVHVGLNAEFSRSSDGLFMWRVTS